MNTPIHTTKKLERLIKPIIKHEKSEQVGILGKWKATVFYVNRKKCWLITNALTRYNLILTNITSKNLPSIDNTFKTELHLQMEYDGINMDLSHLDELIGKLEFLPTDNDKSTTSFQNQRLFDLDCWKEVYSSLEQMPVRDLNHRINRGPFKMGVGSGISNYSDGIREMKRVLNL